LDNVLKINKKEPLIIFLGNKIDILKSNESLRDVEIDDVEEYIKDSNFLFFEVSAKTGQNIFESFDIITEKYYELFQNNDEIETVTKIDEKLSKKPENSCNC
jgi:Ras-related protein Rab-5C